MITHPTVLNLDAAAHRFDDLSRAHKEMLAEQASARRRLRFPAGFLLRAFQGRRRGDAVRPPAAEAPRPS